MSIQSKIPTADFSASGAAKLVLRKGGFDVTNLDALYLFEDGSNGASMSVATDSSGNARHASLFAGSVAPLKASSGANKPNSAGSFLYSIPGVSFGVAFSSVIVFRSALTPGNSAYYPRFWVPSADVAGGTLANVQLSGEAINADLSNATNTAGSGNAAWFAFNGYMTPALNSGGVRQNINIPGATKNDWIAAAFSYDPSSDRYRIAAGTGTFDLVSTTASSATKAKTGTHCFGVGKWSSQSDMPGDIGLYAQYSGAKSIAELQDLLVRAKTRMALRGVTVF